jgi:hypothetical protein
LKLNEFMSRKDHLEVGDVHLEDGVLYFNEACQTYSRDAGGECSSLVAIDPAAGKELWRTKPLVSNGAFMFHGDFIVTIYAFSREGAHLHVLRRRDGQILLRQKIEQGNWDLRVHEDGHLQTAAFGDRHFHYEMIAWDTEKPKLRRVKD